MKRLQYILLLLLIALLCACSGQADAPLPTQVVIPTEVVEQPSATVPTPEIVTAAPTTEIPGTTPAQPLTTESGTVTITFTPSKTITNTITPIPSATFTETREPSLLDDILTAASVFTPLPSSYLGTPPPSGIVITPTLPPGTVFEVACIDPPTGGFGFLFTTDLYLKQQLGCPVTSPATNVVRDGALQTFQSGFMIWASGVPNYIYVFYTNGNYHRYEDTFVDGVDPVSGGETPPSGLLEPVRGFGKIWRTFPEVRSGLGWATQAEAGGTATSLDFQYGLLLHITTRTDILIIAPQSAGDSGVWRAVPGAP